MEHPWKIIAAFVGVFVAGAIFGGFFSIGMSSRRAETERAVPSVATPPPAEGTTAPTRKAEPGAHAARPPLLQVPPRWQAGALLRRYEERLGLTAEQKRRVTPLIRRAAEDYRRVQQNSFRETGFILQRLQHDLAQELTPEQRTKLEKMDERQREALLQIDPKLRDQKRPAGAPRLKRTAPATDATSAGAAAPTSAAESTTGTASTEPAVPAE